MNQPTQSISVLRHRMIDDMGMRKLSPKTQSQYIRAVRQLAQQYPELERHSGINRKPDCVRNLSPSEYETNRLNRETSRANLNYHYWGAGQGSNPPLTDRFRCIADRDASGLDRPLGVASTHSS